jgi:hypothetical protein
MTVISDSVHTATDTASGPIFDTQKMSATAKIDSITISSTMGTASRRIARPSVSTVRSRREPASASRTSAQNPAPAGAGRASSSSADASEPGKTSGMDTAACCGPSPPQAQARRTVSCDAPPMSTITRSIGKPSPRLRLVLLAAVLAAPLLASGRAHAGVTLVMQRGKDPESTLYVDGDKMRMENPRSSNERAVVIDAAAKHMLMINDSEKSYSEMTEADLDRAASMLASRRAMMQERLKSMPPDQRARMEKMMGGAEDKPHELKFVKLGTKKTVNGFACEMYRVTDDGQPKEEDCIAPWSSAVLTRADFAGLRKYSEDMAKKLGAMAGKGNRIFEQFDKFPGFPVVRHSLESGDREDEQLKSVKRGSIPASTFAAPTGYTKKPSPFELMGGGPPGGRPMTPPQ